MTFLVSLVHGGDSIAGSNSPAGYFFQAFSFSPYGDNSASYSQSFQTYYSGANLIARNMGVTGTRLNSGNPEDFALLAPVKIDPLIPSSYTIPPHDKARGYILTNAIGSNDGAIGSYGAGNYTQYADAVATATSARKTAGFNRVAMCTLLPRSANMNESDRLGYNSMIKGAGWAAARNIDYIIDLASQATMGNPATCANTTYYIDGLHPTGAGHALLAPIYLAGVNAMIAML